ncbi:MAG: glycosyltransferase, partial [Deltaproteobacteria bacterium]
AAAHFYLSTAYTSIAQNEEALREALTAVELVELEDITNKLFVNAYYTAARLHSQAGHFDAAVELCRRALARFGDQIDIFAIQTKISFEKQDWTSVIASGGRYREALARYRNHQSKPELVNICTYGDEWRICCWMGTAMLHLADPAGAEALFARAMEISPDKMSVCRHAGTGYADIGRFDRSRFYLEEAYRLSGANKDQSVVEGLFKIGLVTGDAALRDRSLTDALSLQGDLAIWLSDLADFAVSHRDSHSAVVLLAGIIAIHDGNIPARLKLSHILVLQGMIESVVSQCDTLLWLLGLPRDRTLSSLADLGDLFHEIGAKLQEKDQSVEAAIALTIAQGLSTHANKPSTINDARSNDYPKISLSMIVKNESECLERCLESVLPLVDEMVIVDTGSTDGTPDIARQCGAHVYSFPWNDDFSAARNFALSKVKGEWTLVMDADEVIAQRDIDKIKALLGSGRADAYRLVLRNYVADANYANTQPNPKDYQEGNGYPAFIPVPLIRIFRTGPDIRFEGCVHETLDSSLVRAGKRVADSGIPIHHYGKAMTARILQKRGFYKKLGVNKLLGNPDNPLAYKTLADQYLEMDLSDQALEVAESGLRLFPEYAELHFDKGLALERSGSLREAEKAYYEAIARDNCHVGAFNNLAGLLLRRHNHVEALNVLQSINKSCMNHPVLIYTLGLINKALDNPTDA